MGEWVCDEYKLCDSLALIMLSVEINHKVHCYSEGYDLALFC